MADTFTTRLTARKADPADNIDVNAHINANSDIWDLNMGFRICTSTTRPASPWQGLQIYETDTLKTWFWNGSAWKQIASDGGAITMASALTLTSALAMNNVAITVNRGTSTNPIFNGLVTGDANNRLVVDATGKLSWGPGTATQDANLARTGVGRMTLTGSLTATGNAAVVAEDATVGQTTTSLTFVTVGALSAACVVPPSGAVCVHLRCTSRNSSASLYTYTSYDAVGSSSGTKQTSGTGANVSVAVLGTANISYVQEKIWTGLTVGETFTVTPKHAVNSASTATIDYRYLSVTPQL